MDGMDVLLSMFLQFKGIGTLEHLLLLRKLSNQVLVPFHLLIGWNGTMKHGQTLMTVTKIQNHM